MSTAKEYLKFKKNNVETLSKLKNKNIILNPLIIKLLKKIQKKIKKQ